MNDDTKRAVRSQFGRQASWYTVSKVHGESVGLTALLRMASPSSKDRALDVATGTGFTALALAPHCREVVGVDFTPGMLREARGLRETRGIANLRFCLGDAEALPFREGGFDIVTCRHASHHFPHVSVALGEMARVVRPGGRVVLDDTCTPEDPELAALMTSGSCGAIPLTSLIIRRAGSRRCWSRAASASKMPSSLPSRCSSATGSGEVGFLRPRP